MPDNSDMHHDDGDDDEDGWDQVDEQEEQDQLDDNYEGWDIEEGDSMVIDSQASKPQMIDKSMSYNTS